MPLNGRRPEFIVAIEPNHRLGGGGDTCSIGRISPGGRVLRNSVGDGGIRPLGENRAVGRIDS